MADAAHVARASSLAAEAVDPFRAAPLEMRAQLFETCAENIGAIGGELLQRAGAETGLPRGRLDTERTRRINQLRLVARVVRQGDFLELRIDPAQAERTPVPRSDP